MRFWTALQYPLCQAALVCDGRIEKTIPARPPQTPARRVGLVGEYKDCLVVGRRCNIELWDRNGTTLIRSIYHPWIYSLHDCLQVGDDLFLASATLDVVFRMNSEGKALWSWWAHRDDLCAEPTFIHGNDWPALQLTQNIDHETAHLNSIQLGNENTILATLLRPGIVVELDFTDAQPVSQIVEVLEDAAPHDFQRHLGHTVYGSADAIIIGERRTAGYSFVKRIVPLPGEQYLFTHEEGVSVIDSSGHRSRHWTLPRPFGIAWLEDSNGRIHRDQKTPERTACQEPTS